MSLLAPRVSNVPSRKVIPAEAPASEVRRSAMNNCMPDTAGRDASPRSTWTWPSTLLNKATCSSAANADEAPLHKAASMAIVAS